MSDVATETTDAGEAEFYCPACGARYSTPGVCSLGHAATTVVPLGEDAEAEAGQDPAGGGSDSSSSSTDAASTTPDATAADPSPAEPAPVADPAAESGATPPPGPAPAAEPAPAEPATPAAEPAPAAAPSSELEQALAGLDSAVAAVKAAAGVDG